MTIEYRSHCERLRQGEEEADDEEDGRRSSSSSINSSVEHLECCIQRITVDVLEMTSRVSMMTGAHQLRANKSNSARRVYGRLSAPMTT